MVSPFSRTGAGRREMLRSLIRRDAARFMMVRDGFSQSVEDISELGSIGNRGGK